MGGFGGQPGLFPGRAGSGFTSSGFHELIDEPTEPLFISFQCVDFTPLCFELVAQAGQCGLTLLLLLKQKRTLLLLLLFDPCQFLLPGSRGFAQLLFFRQSLT